MSEAAKTFRDMESSINHLDRWGDIALLVCRGEIVETIKVVEDGNATVCVLGRVFINEPADQRLTNRSLSNRSGHGPAAKTA
jgi:hypothetical protein